MKTFFKEFYCIPAPIGHCQQSEKFCLRGPMREEETNRKFLCAVPIGRCWRGPSGEANERGREMRKEHKSAFLRLHHSPGGRKARYDKKLIGTGISKMSHIT